MEKLMMLKEGTIKPVRYYCMHILYTFNKIYNKRLKELKNLTSYCTNVYLLKKITNISEYLEQ